MINNLLRVLFPVKGRNSLKMTRFIGLFLLSFGTLTTVSAADSYAQNKRLTVELNNITMRDVFNEIEKTSEYIFFYSDEVNVFTKVSVSVNDRTIDEIMKQVLKDTDYTYSVSDRQVFVKPVVKEKAVDTATVVQQQRPANGVVVDKGGEPIIGANIVVKGNTSIGTITDIDGKFSLNNIPENAVLIVSYIGYKTQEVAVRGTGTVQVVMEDDSAVVDEVVVIGYGVQKKANLTGSVATLNTEALESRSVSSVSAALAGQMPGVTAVQASGAPGSQSATITIRGKNSINTASPLIIIDGVPSNATAMNAIDPNDIASLSVLKDAASSAIYGVQAANGVILLTTKRGKKDSKPTVNYSGSVAWSSPTTLLDFLGAGDYAMLYNEAVRNESSTAPLPYTEEDIQKFRDGSSPSTHPNTDWYKETFKSWAPETYHNISISGGSDKTVYNASVGYTYQGALLDDNDYKRYNVRASVDSEISKWLTAGLNVNGYRGIREEGWDRYDAVRQYANRLAPTIPMYNEDGSYYFSGIENPLAHRQGTGFRRQTKQEVNATAYANIQILPELSVKGLFSVRNELVNDEGFKRKLTYGFDTKEREGYDNYYTRNWYTSQVLVNYLKTFGPHTIAALAGFEQNEYIYKFTKAERKGGGNNELMESLNTLDAASQKNEDGGYEIARQSYFGRIQYDYLSKYLFEANLRADASSRFPKDNRWGVFPAFSAGWRISEEAFLRESGADWLSNLKLRLGWGITGNEELKDDVVYPSIAGYKYDKYVIGNAVYSTALESRYVNSALKWAEVTNYEAAIEAGFFNNKLGFELAVYKKETKDMLLELPVPGILGMDAPYQNAGKMSNVGFDLSLFHNNQINKDFGYAVNLNVAYVKNKIVDIHGQNEERKDTDGRQWFVEGYPLGSFYGYIANGFFNTEDELANYPKRDGKEKLGDIKYLDINGYDENGKLTGKPDGKIDSADRTVIGKEFPTWTSGLTLNVFWKDFDLSVFFQGAFDVDGYYTNEAAYAFFNNGKVLKRHLDRWTPDNHNASYPRITKDTQINYQTSSFWLQDASYVRMKNITIGYNLPKSLLHKVGVERVKVYVSGENLLTFTGLDGIDPEAPTTNRGAFYSNVKKISLGLKVSF